MTTTTRGRDAHLVTGATGFVGAALVLVLELLRRTDVGAGLLVGEVALSAEKGPLTDATILTFGLFCMRLPFAVARLVGRRAAPANPAS